MNISLQNTTHVARDGSQTFFSRYELEPVGEVTLQYHGLAPSGDLLVPGLSSTFRPALGAARHREAYDAHLTEQKRLFSQVARTTAMQVSAIAAGCLLAVAVGTFVGGPVGMVAAMFYIVPAAVYAHMHLRPPYLAALRARETAEVAQTLCGAYDWLSGERTMADKRFAVDVMYQALGRSYVRGLRDARLNPLMLAYCDLINDVFA